MRRGVSLLLASKSFIFILGKREYCRIRISWVSDQYPHVPHHSYLHAPWVGIVGREKHVHWPTCANGTVGTIESSNSNPINKCCLGTVTGSGISSLPLAQLRIHFYFHSKQKVILLSMGLKFSLLSSECLRGYSCHRICSLWCKKWSCHVHIKYMNKTPQNPCHPYITLPATLASSPYLSPREDTRICCIFLTNSVLQVNMPIEW